MSACDRIDLANDLCRRSLAIFCCAANGDVMQLEIKKRVQIPHTPNHIRVEGDADQSIPIAELTDEQLSEIADEWKRRLIADAQEKRKVKRELEWGNAVRVSR